MIPPLTQREWESAKEGLPEGGHGPEVFGEMCEALVCAVPRVAAKMIVQQVRFAHESDLIDFKRRIFKANSRGDVTRAVTDFLLFFGQNEKGEVAG